MDKKHWLWKTEDERKLLAFESRCLRRIARIKYTDQNTNVEIRQRLQFTETILIKIKKQQLRWFGHVKRMELSHLPKITPEWSLHSLRPRGRPRKRWMGNLRFDSVKIAQLSFIAPDRVKYWALTHDKIKLHFFVTKNIWSYHKLIVKAMQSALMRKKGKVLIRVNLYSSTEFELGQFSQCKRGLDLILARGGMLFLKIRSFC